jgi:hypothetical protein
VSKENLDFGRERKSVGRFERAKRIRAFSGNCLLFNIVEEMVETKSESK